MYNDKSIADVVREMLDQDENGETTYSEYVTGSMREDIDKSEAYINSKHISGDTDYMGRDKPFFNIVMAARNVWYRATDIDRKDIKVRATKETDELKAFLATLKLQEWMKKADFGQFLNDWGLNLATHGSTIAKFIEKDGELSAQVMNWNNFICDAVEFEGNPKIEKLWFTPAQLRKQKGYDKELVKVLLETTTTRKTSDGQTKDNKDDFILVYEVHGEFPQSYLTGKETDEDTYTQQMHVISLTENKEDSTGNEFESYTLYQGKEAIDPYMITHLIKKEGQTYSGGAVKNLFEAQWMVNHSEKQIKDQLDLASKIIFQTSDGAFVDQNVFTNIENGDILKHNKEEPLTRLAGTPDITAMQTFKADWQNIAGQINSVSEAMLGETPKSGTAWRQTQAVLQESHSLFELMTENKGLAIIRMLRDYVIPYFKKKLDNSDEISMILEDYQIKEIDNRYVTSEVTRMMNQKKINIILSGKIYDPTQEEGLIAQTEEEVKSSLTGNQRFIKPSSIDGTTWKKVLKDLEWDLDIDVTGEQKDLQGAMATLTTVFQTMASNPAILQDPNVRLVFNKIIGLAGGISPMEIQATQAQPQPQIQPTGEQAGLEQLAQQTK